MLEDRVRRLERQNRLLWRAAATAVLLAALAGGAGMAVASGREVVEASRFVLKDADGAVRAELAVDDDGTGRLTLYDETARVVGELPFRQQVFPLGR
jgi:hypothetical protein